MPPPHHQPYTFKATATHESMNQYFATLIDVLNIVTKSRKQQSLYTTISYNSFLQTGHSPIEFFPAHFRNLDTIIISLAFKIINKQAPNYDTFFLASFLSVFVCLFSSFLTHSFNHQFIHQFNHSTIHPSIHPFTCSFVSFLKQMLNSTYAWRI